jgi:ectoine hydroxylase
VIAELIRDPRILERARQLLGSEVFYWHSDFETWHAEDGMPAPRAVSMSLALTANFTFNGGLMVMPGSHRTFVPCIGETPADHYKASLKEQEIGGYPAGRTSRPWPRPTASTSSPARPAPRSGLTPT